MQLFKSYCLHAFTDDLQKLHAALSEILEVLNPSIQNMGSSYYPCLFWEAISSMYFLVSEELEYREEGHRRAKERAEELLRKESQHTATTTHNALHENTL